jgi:hypothetical protein
MIALRPLALGREAPMAAVPRPSAQATWLSFNVPRTIVMVRAPGVDDDKAVTAHNRPGADVQLKRFNE